MVTLIKTEIDLTATDGVGGTVAERSYKTDNVEVDNLMHFDFRLAAAGSRVYQAGLAGNIAEDWSTINHFSGVLSDNCDITFLAAGAEPVTVKGIFNLGEIEVDYIKIENISGGEVSGEIQVGGRK